MTIYRQVHVHMWKDEWFVGLTVHERLLFTYLIRNERAHFSGLFDLPVGVMAFETSIPEDEVRETLAASERQGRICYEAETGKIFVKNLMCYNGGSASNKRVMANLRKQGDDLSGNGGSGRSCNCRQGIDTPSAVANVACRPPLQELELELEQEKNTNTNTTRARVVEGVLERCAS